MWSQLCARANWPLSRKHMLLSSCTLAGGSRRRPITTLHSSASTARHLHPGSNVTVVAVVLMSPAVIVQLSGHLLPAVVPELLPVKTSTLTGLICLYQHIFRINTTDAAMLMSGFVFAARVEAKHFDHMGQQGQYCAQSHGSPALQTTSACQSSGNAAMLCT